MTKAHLIILHPEQVCLLMQQHHDGWLLPLVVLTEYQSIGVLLQQLRHGLALESALLRCIEMRYNQKQASWECIYLLECIDPGWNPPAHMHWIGQEQIDQIPLLHSEQREAIAHCLHEEVAGVVPALRPRWERRGWFSSTVTWLQASLTSLGYRQTGAIEQVQLWCFACVLRIPTTSGMLYFKASPVLGSNGTNGRPCFWTNEVDLTQMVAKQYPAHLPVPVLVDTQQGWMVVKDAGVLLDEQPEQERWENALQAFSHLQLASTARVDQFLTSGCPDRRLEKLREHLDLLIADREVFSLLTRDEREQVRKALPRCHALCGQLERLPISASLVHGDLYPGNIAFGHGTPTFLDWADGCISHPFFDIMRFCLSSRLRGMPQKRAQLQAAYVAPWKAIASGEQLQKAMALVEVLGRLHQAISFQQALRLVEPPWERSIRDSLTFWLRSFLQVIAET
jgi:hypothetical protein